MAYSIERVDVWAGSISDKPGGLAATLAPLADAKCNLEFVVARRSTKGKGLVFVAPVKGAAGGKAAKAAGLAKTAELSALRIEGGDKAGLGVAIGGALGDAGISMRGISAAAIGRKSVCWIALDSKADATKAKRVLAKALG